MLSHGRAKLTLPSVYHSDSLAKRDLTPILHYFGWFPLSGAFPPHGRCLRGAAPLGLSVEENLVQCNGAPISRPFLIWSRDLAGMFYGGVYLARLGDPSGLCRDAGTLCVRRAWPRTLCRA